MDTLGSLIDKLLTADLKMWNNQELLYKIRKMSLEEFLLKFNDAKKMSELYEWLQKATDLNLQRNQLIDEIDKLVISMIKSGLDGDDLDNGRYIQRKHKTY